MKGLALIGLLLCHVAWAAPTVMRDLAYGDHPRQQLDIHVPEGARRAPVILMVHGGGWKHGDKALGRVVSRKVAYWGSRGVIVASANYRLLPEFVPHLQLEDIARALAFVQRHAADWGGDPARVVLMGHSAGGHLVALLGVMPAVLAQQGARPPLAVVPLDSGALDLPAIMRGPHIDAYDEAFGRDSSYWQRLSPLYQLQTAPPPFLIVCSSRRWHPCADGERFAARIRELKGQAEVLPQALSHLEVNARLGAPGDYTRAVDAFLSKVHFYH